MTMAKMKVVMMRTNLGDIWHQVVGDPKGVLSYVPGLMSTGRIEVPVIIIQNNMINDQ